MAGQQNTVPTDLVKQLIRAVKQLQRNGDGDADMTIITSPDGKFVVLVGTTKDASDRIIAAYESIPGPITFDGKTD